MVLAFHGVVLIQPAGPASNCRDYIQLTAKGWENTIPVTTRRRPPASSSFPARWLHYSRVQCGPALPNSRPWSAREQQRWSRQLRYRTIPTWSSVNGGQPTMRAWQYFALSWSWEWLVVQSTIMNECGVTPAAWWTPGCRSHLCRVRPYQQPSVGSWPSQAFFWQRGNRIG